MKYLFFISFITAINSAFGQFFSTENRVSVKLTPLAFIDGIGGYSYRIGTEFKTHKSISTSLELGGYYSYGSNPNYNLKLNPIGFLIRTEVRRYLNNDNSTLGYFISIEYQYKDIAFDYLDSIKIDLDPTFQKQYRIYKHISCITVKYGDVITYNRFLVEWFAGIGIRICDGRNTLTDQESNGVLTGEFHGDIIGDGQRAINYVAPNFSLGFRVGYILK